MEFERKIRYTGKDRYGNDSNSLTVAIPSDIRSLLRIERGDKIIFKTRLYKGKLIIGVELKGKCLEPIGKGLYLHMKKNKSGKIITEELNRKNLKFKRLYKPTKNGYTLRKQSTKKENMEYSRLIKEHIRLRKEYERKDH